MNSQNKNKAALPDSEKGQVRDNVAAVVGVGGKSIDNVAKIVKYAPSLVEKVKQGKIDLEPADQKARGIERQKQSIPVETVETKQSLPAAHPEQETVEIFRKPNLPIPLGWANLLEFFCPDNPANG